MTSPTPRPRPTPSTGPIITIGPAPTQPPYYGTPVAPGAMSGPAPDTQNNTTTPVVDEFEPTVVTIQVQAAAVSNDGTAYAYDVFNRLVSVNETASGTTRYTYRPNGMRQAKIGAVITTHFWDGANIVADIEGNSITTYLRGVNLIASVKGSTKNYYLYNAHGDVVLFGSRAYRYDAFGNELATNANDVNPFRYAGEYFDGETGSYYLRARYYEPSTGRFSSEDPAKAGLNWYTYCSGNPVLFIDPSGLAEVPFRAYALSYAGAVVDWKNNVAYAVWNGIYIYVPSTAQNNKNGRIYVDSSLFSNKWGDNKYAGSFTPASVSLPGAGTKEYSVGDPMTVAEFAEYQSNYAKQMQALYAEDPASAVWSSMSDSADRNFEGIWASGLALSVYGGASRGWFAPGTGSNKLPTNDSQIKHIFGNRTGHLPDTPANRSLVESVANNSKNYVGTDAKGTNWYSHIQSDGSQIWVRTYNGTISNAGVNSTPRTFDPITGFNNNPLK